MTTGSPRDAGPPPGLLLSTELYQADSSNTLDLDSIPAYTSRYTSLLDESTSGSSLESSDYQHPADAPLYPTCAPLKPRDLTPLAGTIMGSPSFEDDGAPILITSPRPAYVKAIPKLSDLDHIDFWLNFTAGQAPLDPESPAAAKSEKDWVPEGSLYSPSVFKSRLSSSHAHPPPARPASSRAPTPSERPSPSHSADLDSPAAEPRRTASHDDLARRRTARVFNATLIEGSRRWSAGAPDASREGATNHSISGRAEDEQGEGPRVPDYLTQAIPRIKLSNSEHTLAFSLPSTVPSSEPSEPDHPAAHGAEPASLADRRGKPPPGRLALERPADALDESYPSIPAAFMFSPTTPTADVNPFSPTDSECDKQIASGRDTHDMIKQLQQVASQFKPTTPTDLAHNAASDSVAVAGGGVAPESTSENSLASLSLQPTDGDANTRTFSLISEDEWGFARELMNATGDPLPPKPASSKGVDDGDAIPPVPKIPVVHRVAALRSPPVPTESPVSRLPKANARTAIPQALIPGVELDSANKTPARSLLRKPTGIQPPSRRVPSPAVAASASPTLPGARPRSATPDAAKSGSVRTPGATQLPRKATPSSIARSTKTVSAQKPTQKPARPASPASASTPVSTPASTGSMSRMPVRSGAAARRTARSTLPAMPVVAPAAPKASPQPESSPSPTPAAPKDLSAAQDIFSSLEFDTPPRPSPSPPAAAPIYTSVSDSAALPLPSSPTAMSDRSSSSPRPRGILKHRKKVWWDDAQNTVTAIPDLVADSAMSPEESALPTPDAPASPRTPTLSWRKLRAQSVMLRGSPAGGADADARRRSFAAPASLSDGALSAPGERSMRRAFSFGRAGADKEGGGEGGKEKENRFRFSLAGAGFASSRQVSAQAGGGHAKKPSFMSLLGKLRA